MDITPYLKLMSEQSASDLFITANSHVKIKKDGHMQSVGKTVLTSEICEAVAYDIMNDKQKSVFEETKECDFAIALVDDPTRFRVNIFRQREKTSLVLRRIPSKIPSANQLGLPAILKEVILYKRGLLLMAGSTGSGKSTTLAAMINHRNENYTGHILTIEDPVEFSHPNLKSIVNQREVGVDTLSYQKALKSSLREAPDLIFVGEVRDRKTMETVIELSNTGHLAVTTLHANNSNQAIERILGFFPPEDHKKLCMDLSLNIRGIISQRLVKSVDGKRCAAIEILINTPHIADLILRGDLDEIKAAMDQSGMSGMQTFDGALLNLYKEGIIELDEALQNADSRRDLEAKINFG